MLRCPDSPISYLRRLRRSPTGDAGCQIQSAYDVKAPRQAFLVSNRADGHGDGELQAGAGEVERILHSSDEVFWDGLHDGGGDGDASERAGASHDGVDHGRGQEGHRDTVDQMAASSKVRAKQVK